NERPDWSSLWDDLSAYRGPLTLVRGAVSPVVADEDVDELRRRRPDAHVVVVDGAGHSVQGDQPLELAEIITHALARTGRGSWTPRRSPVRVSRCTRSRSTSSPPRVSGPTARSDCGPRPAVSGRRPSAPTSAGGNRSASTARRSCTRSASASHATP